MGAPVMNAIRAGRPGPASDKRLDLVIGPPVDKVTLARFLKIKEEV